MDIKPLDEVITQRKSVLDKIKLGLTERLNLPQKLENLDDDTPLFGSGLKLDSVDATEVMVLLDESFGIRVTEGDDPSYMRNINTLATFVIAKLDEAAQEKMAIDNTINAVA